MKTRSRLLILFLKLLLWLLTVPVTLIALTVIALQIPAVQNYLAQKVVNYVTEKTGAVLSLKTLSFNLNGEVELEDLLLRDQQKDTLLYSHYLAVGVDVAGLFSRRITLNKVELETLTGHVQRDSAGFNFDFITDAFSSVNTDTVIETGTKKGWEFSLKRIRLKRIYATYADAVAGINVCAQLGNFDTHFTTFDLDRQKIKVGPLLLDSSTVSVALQKRPDQPDTTATTATTFDIDASDLDLKQVNFVYEGGDGSGLDAKVGQLGLRVNKIDLSHTSFDVAQLNLANSVVKYVQGKEQVIVKEKTTRAQDRNSAPRWQVKLNHLSLENNTFAYDNQNKKSATEGMDYQHWLLRELNAKANNISAGPDRISAQVLNLAAKEKSGFSIREFRSALVYDTNHIAASGLVLKTGHSEMAGDLGISYTSLQTLTDSIERMGMQASLKASRVMMADVLYFVPGLLKSPYLSADKTTNVLIDGQIHGTLNDLRISDLVIKTGTTTTIQLDGHVKRLLVPGNMYADLRSFRFSGSRSDVFALVSDSLIPPSIQLPELFRVTGRFTGYLKNFNAIAHVQTSIGDAEAKIRMNPAAGNQEQPYHVELSTKELDLGKMLRRPDFGTVTMKTVIDGRGLDTTSLNAVVKLTVEKAVFRGYAYSTISVDAALKKQAFSGQVKANDRNLSFVFDGTIDLDPKQPAYTFTLDLKGADLRALNLGKEDLRVSALVQSDIRDRHEQNISGRAVIRNLQLIRATKKYRLDSLVLSSERKDSVWEIGVSSELVTANFKGDITLAQLPEQLNRQVNSYFKFREVSTTKQLAPQKFEFTLDVLKPDMLTGEVIPGLEKITPAAIKGSYNSEAMELKLDANIPELVYSGIKMDSLKLTLRSDREKLSYRIDAAELSNPNLKTENLYLGGELKNNTLSFQCNTNKDDSTRLLSIGGALKSTADKKYELHLNPEVVFNAENWQVDAENYFVFSKAGAYAHQVNLSSTGRVVSLNSSAQVERAPLEIKFTNFELATLSRVLENRTDLFRGQMNGSVILEKHGVASAFRSDLVISDFVFKSVPVGTIRLKADNFENAQTYHVDLSIEGNGNDIKANGSYIAVGKRGNLDLEVTVHNLGLASIEPFVSSQVSGMSGGANGHLRVTGNPRQPDINGELHFKESAFRPKLLDSYLVIHEGKLEVSGGKARVNNLALYDSLNNKAVVNGFVDIKDLAAMRFDLQVKTWNFLALNTDRKDNPLYYGRVFLDSDIKLRGTMDAPDLVVKAKLNPGSSVTYVKPESMITKSESKGIVEFTDSLRRDTTIMLRAQDSLTSITGVRGLDLDATLNIDRSVELKMIVDQENGDSLYLVGGGMLDFHLDRNGKTSLTGKYRINDGGYYLSVNNLVKRNFKIEKGSSVTWSGDILDAYVDLKAVYRIKTSPIDLVQEELAGMGELEKNKYRNLLTFMVYLKMQGFISSPEISFDIQLAPGDRGALNGAINTRLAQLREDETELNKQVFALLTLRRFVSSNPLDNSGEGGGLSSASRSSASKVLTQQLSNLSNRYVNFVDLDLGVNSFEDYSTGREEGRTQLQVGVSKQLLKDKVTVHVGGNVELEGERASQNNASDVAGNISIDYKLTQDGRYKLKAFRENQYENPIEGELTKTGMGLIYVRNYNRFKELLKKPVRRPNPLRENDPDKKSP